MGFLRRQLFLIVCLSAAVVGIALGITGMRSMPKVKEEMEKAHRVYQSLGGLESNPVNRAHVEAEERRIGLIREDHQRIIDEAKELYGWEQLVPEVLPYGPPLQRLDFRKKYGSAMRSLQQALTGGGPASVIDIRNMRDRIANEEAALRESASNPLIPAPTVYDGPPRTPANVLTRAGAQRDAVARAHLQAAQRIYCYITTFREEKPLNDIYASLEFDVTMADVDTTDPPFPDEVWNAQLGYWIQKDVVDAIATINEAAAKEAVDRGDYGWVGNMPVKEVISVRLAPGFVPPQGEPFYGTAPGGYEVAMPPGTPETVFTRSGSGESFDVVQFSVKLIMDQRDIMQFVERLCNETMYVPLRIAYKEVSVNRNMVGKIYGSEPAVNVTFDFEAVLLGQVFRRYMPQYVREQYAVLCREKDECQAPPE